MTGQNIEDENQAESGPHSPGDEARIVALLERFDPRPSERFYRRMAGAPWKHSQGNRTWISRLSPHRGLRLAAAGVVMLLVLAMAVLADPALRATGRQWISFFIPNPTETLQLQITIPSPGDPNVFDAPGYFAISMAEAERQAGFAAGELSLAEVSEVMPGLEFMGAHYDPEMKLLVASYSVDGRRLYLSKRLSGPVQEYSSIGPGALVEKVFVHGVEGEYVAGGWVTSQSLPTTPQPGDSLNLVVTWDPSLPQHILRWQEGDFLYEILASASLGQKIELDRDALILIAEAVK